MGQISILFLPSLGSHKNDPKIFFHCGILEWNNNDISNIPFSISPLVVCVYLFIHMDCAGHDCCRTVQTDLVRNFWRFILRNTKTSMIFFFFFSALLWPLHYLTHAQVQCASTVSHVQFPSISQMFHYLGWSPITCHQAATIELKQERGRLR